MSNILYKLIKGTKYAQGEYNNLVVKLIRQKYSINDELAILRQQATKPTEFEEYNNYVELCKQKAKTELN